MCDNQSRGERKRCEDAVLWTLKVEEGTGIHGIKTASRIWKGKEIDCPYRQIEP